MPIKITLFEFWKQKEIEWSRTITVTEIHNATDISRDTLTRLRSGRTDNPDMYVVGKLCAFFNVPPGPVPFLVYEKD